MKYTMNKKMKCPCLTKDLVIDKFNGGDSHRFRDAIDADLSNGFYTPFRSLIRRFRGLAISSVPRLRQVAWYGRHMTSIRLRAFFLANSRWF